MTDFDDDFDFDDAAFDDLDGPDAFPGTGPEGFADLDPETLAVLDGASAEAFATRKARLSKVLADGETGGQVAALALFAERLAGPRAWVAAADAARTTALAAPGISLGYRR